MAEAVKKPKLSKTDVTDLEDLFKTVGGMPDGPEKQAQLAELKEFTDFVLTQKEAPTPNWGEKLLGYGISGLDYVPGLVRTGVGEAALAVQAMNDPNKEYDLGAAKERVVEAVKPDMRPATSVGEYRKMLGAQMSAEAEAKPLIPGDFIPEQFNPSQGTAIDVGLDALLGLSPTAFVKGVGKLLGKNTAKMTYRQAETALAEALKKNPSFVQKSLAFINEPVAKTGEALYRFRLRNADKATKAAGMRRFSDVMMENGRPGITSQGIEEGVQDILAKKSAAKREIVEGISDANPNQPMVKLGEVTQPLYEGEFKKNMGEYGATRSYKEARDKAVRGLEETAAERMGIPLEELDNVEVAPTIQALAKEQPLTALDLEGAAARAGDNARAARYYDKPGISNVPSATDRARFIKQNQAYGEAQDILRDKSRRLQGDLLDEMSPGSGGEVFKYNKDTAALLKGAPFVDRPFSKAAASSRSQNWLAPPQGGGIWDRVGQLALDSKDAAMTATGKTLMNPWVRYMATPLGRAAVVEDYAPESRNNIWYYLDKAKEK